MFKTIGILTDEELREWRDRQDPSGQSIHAAFVIPLINQILILREYIRDLEIELALERDRNKPKEAHDR
jgi:hypothetical protein